jgi:hypothetical protein
MRLIAETFDAHQPAIGRYARATPQGFARVYKFVLATIQQPLISTPEIVRDFELIGTESKWAFGMKGGALRWLAEEGKAEWLHRVALDTWEAHSNPDAAEEELVSFFAGLPGLGLIKGGFLAQLAFGLGGCLDRHNFARFGLPYRSFRADSFKRAGNGAQRRHVRAYLDACRDAGGCALLWAEWCDYVAKKEPVTYNDAAYVSRLHVVATIEAT